MLFCLFYELRSSLINKHFLDFECSLDEYKVIAFYPDADYSISVVNGPMIFAVVCRVTVGVAGEERVNVN